MHLLFTSWIVYFVFGMYMAKYEKEKIDYKSFAINSLTFIITTALVICTQYLANLDNHSFNYYASLFMIYAISACEVFFDLFKIFKKDTSKLQDFTIKLFDNNTYFIFLYHVLFISIARFDIITNYGFSYKINQVIIWTFTFICILILCIIRNAILKIKLISLKNKEEQK
jgi:peptidoglycan/LPS O-acetylase OafA/YrhL